MQDNVCAWIVLYDRCVTTSYIYYGLHYTYIVVITKGVKKNVITAVNENQEAIRRRKDRNCF